MVPNDKIKQAVIELKGDDESELLDIKYDKNFKLLCRTNAGRLCFSMENSINSEERLICDHETFIHYAKELGYISETGQLQDPSVVEKKSDEPVYWDGIGEPSIGSTVLIEGAFEDLSKWNRDEVTVVSRQPVCGYAGKFYTICWNPRLEEASTVSPFLFKPVKSPKQKAIEKVVSLLYEEQFDRDITIDDGTEIIGKLYDLNLLKTDI